MKLIMQPSPKLIYLSPDPVQFLEQCGRTAYQSHDKITSDSAAKFIRRLISSGHESVLEHCTASFQCVCDRAVSHELVRHRIASYTQESQRYVNYKEGVTFILPWWIMDNFDMLPVLTSPDFLKDKNVTIVHRTGEPTEPRLRLRAWDNDDTMSEQVELSIPLKSDIKLTEEQQYRLISAAGMTIDALSEAEDAYVQMCQTPGVTPQMARVVLPNATKTSIVVTANFREWRSILKLRTAPDVYPPMRKMMQSILFQLMNSSAAPVFEDLKFADQRQR